MPVTTFLARHLVARGYRLYDRERRIQGWQRLRWPQDGTSLSARFLATSRERGVELRAWLDLSGRITEAYSDLHAAVYEALPVQPTLRDVLGTTSITFTNVDRDVHVSRNLVRDDVGVRTVHQGEGLSAIRLYQDRVSPLYPTEFLALAGALADPTDTSSHPLVDPIDLFSYPNLETIEVLDAIDVERPACGYTSFTEGLCLGWCGPGHSYTLSRARSALRLGS